MPVNFDQSLAGTREFHNRIVIPKTKKVIADPIIISKSMFTFFYNAFLSILILQSGDINLNPGTTKNIHSHFSCCQ